MDFVYEILKGLIVSTVGLLIALLANSAIEARKERHVYEEMLKAIKSEAQLNSEILQESFWKHINQDGIVVGRFSTNTITQHIGNSIFVKYAKESEIKTLNTYLSKLSLANGYREINERIRLGDEKKNKIWKEGLMEVWPANLDECGEYINKIQQFGKSV